VGAALTFVSPVNGVALYVFFGLSMLLAALRGYDGCEILALPNLILRRQDAIWCRSTRRSTRMNDAGQSRT